MSGPGPVLRLRGAGRAFDGRTVLAPLDLALEAGSGVALLGPNGAGKSTVLGLAAGRFRPSVGAVEVEGRDPAGVAAVRARIGYLPHDSLLDPRVRVRDEVELAHQLRGGAAPDPAALREALGLTAVWEARIPTLSQGFGRRVELACALAGGPALLLLDEPLEGLDASIRDLGLAAVRRLVPGAAVLVASHFPEAVRPLADRFLRLEDGRVVAEGSLPGPP